MSKVKASNAEYGSNEHLIRTQTPTPDEIKGIEEALESINEEHEKLEEEGLSQASFFFGIVNLVMTSMIIAKIPQHLWVFYGAKCVTLIPIWWGRVIQRHNGGLWILDFCWVANLCFGMYMVTSIFGAVPAWLHIHCFQTFFAVALGPLGWACLVLHNGLVLHSVERTASLFIHMTPTLVAWTLVYYTDEVAEAWPGRFPGRQAIAEINLWTLYSHGFGFYLIWLFLHSVWLLSVGVRCPGAGYSTVFDDLYQKHSLSNIFTEWTGLEGVRCHAALYLLLHCICCSIAFLWPLLCLRCNWAHTGFALWLVGCSTWWGAGYHDFILGKKYIRVLQQLLKERAIPATKK